MNNHEVPRAMSVLPFFLGLTLLMCMESRGMAAGPVRSVRLVLPENSGAVTRRAGGILSRQVSSRCDAKVVAAGDAEFAVELRIQASPGTDGYQIIDGAGESVQIVGNDERGLLYGVGKFLRSSRYDQGGFTPSTWRGASAPKSPMRGIYLATHFNNYYEAASPDELERYIEDLSLWGINLLALAYPHWQYAGYDDPAARRMSEHLHGIIRVAKSVGMRVSIVEALNGGFTSTPKEMRCVPVPDPLGRHGNFGVNLCPSQPAARELLLKNWAKLLEEFADVGLDCITYWPYDEGGCGCQDCWPWGARGYVSLARAVSALVRQKAPHTQVILSTWTFDTPPTGEWEALTQALAKDRSWVDYIQADAHEDFPRFPLDRGVPGELPILNFPEISMWGQGPWGGYGANPLPGRLQRLWNQTQAKLSGGTPYSEGIYEDINKAICSQFYWDPERAALETVREYAAFEYSPAVADEVVQVVEALEENHLRTGIGPSAERTFQRVQNMEALLTPQARSAWRWRILYLRALIDRELFLTHGKLEGSALQGAFRELTVIYHAENAHSMPIRPPQIVSDAEYWVSANGNDAARGSKDEPFATISRARHEIRTVKARAGNVRVVIRGGTYPLPECLTFDARDGGSESASVTYEAAPGEKVILSGGARIGGWQVSSNGVFTTTLPEPKTQSFRQLIVNDQRAPRARTPNAAAPDPYYRLLHAQFSRETNLVHLSPAVLPSWNDLGQIELVVLANWDITRKLIQSVDRGTGQITLTPPILTGNSAIRPRAGLPCYFENALEYVDAPGEWYLDSRTGGLTYMPLPGQNPAALEVVAPRLTCLLRVQGTAEAPVQNLHFRGLTFAHADWPLPAQGYNGVQAGAFFNPGENDDPDNRWSGRMGAAIEWRFAHSCSLENSELVHLGGAGIRLGEGCQTNRLDGNIIQDIAGNGVMVGEDWFSIYYLDQPEPGDRSIPRGNLVTNNQIRNCGAEYPGTVGIWVSFTDATRVGHNLIHSLPYSGISLGWYWGSKPTACRRNIVEFNHVYDVMRLLADGAAIYTLGLQPGTTLRGNVLHDVHRSQHAEGGAPNNGIFFDEGSSGFLVESNVVYRTSGEPIRFNQTSAAQHRWQGNSLGIEPDSDRFPTALVAKAGLENR